MENYFESFKDDYADEITAIQPEFYANSAKHINEQLVMLKEKGDLRVLDIGNGGVINYDRSLIDKLVCADLSVSDKAVSKYAGDDTICFEQGNMLDLKYDDDSFDAVIVQAVIHHLAGKRMKITESNVERGIRECLRVCKPGGRLLIVESTVSRWFDCLERAFYPLMQFFFSIVRFDSVYQYSGDRLNRKISALGCNVEEYCEVPLDKYIWLLRKKIPSRITPCGAHWWCIRKV